MFLIFEQLSYMPCSLQMQTVGICVRLLARLNGRAMSHTGLIPRWCWSIERWSTWFIIISWHSWGVYLYKLMVMITDVLCQWLLKISPPLQNSEFYSSAFMAFLSLAECRSPLSTSQFRSTTGGIDICWTCPPHSLREHLHAQLRHSNEDTSICGK